MIFKMQQVFPTRGFKKIEFANRVIKVQRVLRECELDALLLSTEADIRYFTGFTTQFWQSPTRPWFIIIKPEGAPIAVIPSIGVQLMKDCYIDEIHSWSSPAQDDDGIGLLRKVLHGVCGKKKMHIGMLMGRETSFRAPLSDILKLTETNSNIKCFDVTDEVQHIRMIKSKPEIEKLRFICQLVSKVFEDLPNWISQGLPLTELFRTFKIKALTNGVDDVPYLVGAAGEGGYFDIIAPPNNRPLKNGDIFMLDTGCVWDGYYSDFDRNFALGYASDEAQKAHHTLIAATEAAAKSIKPGVTTSQDLFHTMNNILYPGLEKSNVKTDDVGRLGHGVGIQLTEPPSHTSWDTTIIKSGMTITLEPSIIYGAKNFLMVAEENILINDSGIEYLTKPCSRDLKIIK
jgi:Xaa-Pro dipeptidase